MAVRLALPGEQTFILQQMARARDGNKNRQPSGIRLPHGSSGQACFG